MNSTDQIFEHYLSVKVECGGTIHFTVRGNSLTAIIRMVTKGVLNACDAKKINAGNPDYDYTSIDVQFHYWQLTEDLNSEEITFGSSETPAKGQSTEDCFKFVLGQALKGFSELLTQNGIFLVGEEGTLRK